MHISLLKEVEKKTPEKEKINRARENNPTTLTESFGRH